MTLATAAPHIILEPTYIANASNGVTRSPESARQLNRLLARARALRPSATFTAPEQYRRWLLNRIDTLAKLDETPAEHAETAGWRGEVHAATDGTLWAEYDAGRVF